MDINGITTLISSVGFPIVCCLYMIFHANKTVEENSKNIIEYNNTLKEMTTVIKENTTATNQLITLLSYFLNKEEGEKV